MAAEEFSERGASAAQADSLGSRGAPKNEWAEAQAIEGAQRGDAAAFEFLYRLHSRRVFAVCLRLGVSRTEAEDLTQEAFLQVFRKIHTFRGDSAFSTWLHRLALNTVLMHLRRKQPPLAPLDQVSDSRSETRATRTQLGSPDASLAGLVDRVRLKRALAQLPWTYRLVFVLYDVLGYTHREIAGLLDCSVGTSKVHLHRARTRLRDLLRESFGEFSLTLQPAP